MLGINEILYKVLSNKKLTEEDRLKIFGSKLVNEEVVEYLINRVNNLRIEVLDEYEGSLFELMLVGKLRTWCWQTTESAIVFLHDDDYVERGYLNLYEKTPLYHSWVCFNFSGIEYVLDPCISFLCKKSDYSRLFKTEVKGRVSAKAVREELIRQVTTPKEEDNSKSHQVLQSILKSYMGESYDSFIERKKREVIAKGPEDVNTPLYRNGAGYKMEIDNGKIISMTVHYYNIEY